MYTATNTQQRLCCKLLNCVVHFHQILSATSTFVWLQALAYVEHLYHLSVYSGASRHCTFRRTVFVSPKVAFEKSRIQKRCFRRVRYSSVSSSWILLVLIFLTSQRNRRLNGMHYVKKFRSTLRSVAVSCLKYRTLRCVTGFIVYSVALRNGTLRCTTVRYVTCWWKSGCSCFNH